MKKLWYRICCLILVIAMMVNFLPLNALAEWDQGNDSSFTSSNDVEELELHQDEVYENSRIVNEHIDNRTEYSKEFLMDSGISMAVVYGSPVHYSKDGKWEEIDNTLKVNSNSTITNTAGVWDVRFPQKISSANKIQITKDGYTLSFGMAGELRRQGNLEIMSDASLPTEERTATSEPVEDIAGEEDREEKTSEEIPQEDVTSIESILEGSTSIEATNTEVISMETIDEEFVPIEETPAMAVLEETLPESTMPAEVIPETTIPEETEHEITVPEETNPETTISEETEPETMIPEETTPEISAPEETIPETTVPEETIPETTVPEETVPETTVPEETIPETTVPEETVPETTVPEETVSETTAPEGTVPKETIATIEVPSVPTTTISIDGIMQTFAINAAKLSMGQIQEIDFKKVIDATEYKETILTKPFSQLMYEGVYSNTDIQYNLMGNQVKESIIMRSYDSDIRGYQFSLHTGELIPVLEDDGHIDLYDPSEETVIMTMPAPYLQDSEMEHSRDIRVILSGSDGKYVLTYMLPLQWLADEERVWPVILDPVVSASPDINNIHDVTVGSIYSYDYQAGVLEAGVDHSNGVQRFFVKYGEIPELSSSDVILGAVVRMYKPYSFSDYRTVEAHKVLEAWENYSMTWSNQPDCDPIIEDYVRVKDEGFYYFDVTDVVRDWYTEGNHGLMFKAPNTAEEQTSVESWVQFYSCNFGAETVSPNLFIYFRNNNGIEGYWDYTSSSAGRAGTGYINQHSGNLVWVHDDIGFGGNRMPVSINHVYNTNDKSSTQYGVGAGWRTNFNQRVYSWDEDSDYYIWEDADGTKHYFEYESYGVYKDEDGMELTLTNTGSGDSTFSITDKNGNTSYFDSYGRLRKQENNQATKSNISVTYTTTSGFLIDTITDGAGRVYDFEYSDGLLSKISYKGTGTGEISSVSYGYTGSNLTAIQYKDGKSTAFTYNSKHLLTSATDIDGYKLRYEYNTTAAGKPSRVSKVSEFDGSVAGGVLNFEYAHNQTTLEDHNGNVQILQFNDYGNTVSVQDGEGHAQYAKYAKNDSEETGKGNQLTAVSKLQNTVVNLLDDGSFEKGIPWTAPSGTAAISSSGYLGNKSMSLTGGRATSTSFSIAAGEDCTFSAYVKTTGEEGSLALYAGESAVATQSFPSCSEWTRVEVNYRNTTASAQTLNAVLQCGTGQTVDMDCVQVEKTPTASRYNILQNSDFNYGTFWAGTGFTDGDGRMTMPSQAAPQLSRKGIRLYGLPSAQKKIRQVVPVSGAAGDTYVVAGWALANAVPLKEENQPEGETREFGIRLIFRNTDGTTTTEVAQFNTATNTEANWQYSSAVAVAEKAYSSIHVEAVYDYNANVAYFDGIQLYKEEFSQSYAYDDDGNVTSVIDLQKQETKYEYTDNDLTKQILPTGAELTYTYDDYHNVLTATTETGVVYKFTYDTYGNNTSVEIVKDGVSIKSSATYSTDGNRMTSATDALGKTTTYRYNANTNVLEWVKYPEDTNATRTNYTYDSMYRMATAAATTDSGLALSAEYTYTDDLLTAIETGSTTYNFGYGDFALRSNVKIGSRTLANYTYTSQNNYLDTLAYGNEDEVQYTYDNLGRVTRQTYEDGATVDYRYDNNGALATVTDSAAGRTTTYYYDFIDRMMKYVESGEDYSHSVGYEYDTINNLTKMVETINDNTYTYTYGYDDDNRVTHVTNTGAKRFYTYDAWGRVSEQSTRHSSTEIKKDTFSFTAPSGTATSSQIAGHTIDAADYDKIYTYTYDNNGNISSVSDGTNTTSYVYDSANQLIRENNEAGEFTHLWSYDNAGNILSRAEYDYTSGELGELKDTVSYSYGDTDWGDLLTAYDGNTITYDQIGNPLNDGTWTYTWQHGRQLSSMSDGTTTWNFTYNADGLRTKRTNGSTTYEYVYNANKLSYMKCGSIQMYFIYDASGTPIAVRRNTTNYYYVTNIQGDVTAILNYTGTPVVEYTYDAWGNLISTTGSMAASLGVQNPLRYRGYLYDRETNLYYLSTRYYNPEVGRFLNADAFNSTGQGFGGNNMFVYCLDNPINFSDSAGCRCVPVKPLGGGAKKEEYKPKPDNGQDTAVKITHLIFETGEAILDGIEAELAIGMGFGGTVSASIEGINISADLFVTTKLALIIDDGMVDIRSISSFGAGVPLVEYLGVDTVKGVSHSLFDPKCTCHFNSSWKDFYECAANQPFFDTAPTLGVSAGGYLVVGGEVALGYDLQAFADSAMRKYESIF